MQAATADNPGEMHAKMLSDKSCNVRILNSGPAPLTRGLCQLHIIIPHLNRTIQRNKADDCLYRV